MVADSKKCQTLINVCAEKALELQAIATRLKALRDAYVAQAVDPAGTPLDGNIAAINSWIADVDTAANNAVANGFISNVVPTHRNAALGV